ncbi:SET domain, partial [Dillenia turbinata]
DKLCNNSIKLQSHISSYLVMARSNKDVSFIDKGILLSSRVENPYCKFSGSAQGFGDKDYVITHEVVPLLNSKLPHIEKIPPYTTWIFLDRNQRMTEDQSVVGRRRIYYDQYGGEALICSDSEEEIAEPEEEKHEFSEGEDRILWMAFQEHGLGEEVLNIVGQFVGGTHLEIQERYQILQENYQQKQNPDRKDSEESGSEKSIILDKSLTAALDSFDNLFCRRCLVFDCRLHGCSQNLIDASEKLPYWYELEDGGEPCSDQCYLWLKESAKDWPGGSSYHALHKIRCNTLKEKDRIPASSDTEDRIPTSSDTEEPSGRGGGESDPNATEDTLAVTSVDAESTQDADGTKYLHMSSINQETFGKRKVLNQPDMVLEDSTPIYDDSCNSCSKKQKASPDANKFQMTAKHDLSEPLQQTIEEHASIGHVPSEGNVDKHQNESKVTMKPEIGHKLHSSLGGQAQVNNEWRPIEKELYLKGVEIFGRNSCLIARNLLSGLKTCIEVSSYMYDDRTVTHKSVAQPSSSMENNGIADEDYMEQEVPVRSRMFRRRGKTRKLKYSWKSAGHPSMWKRIADGKNQSCKQYTPCGCQSMCGKQCSCLDNGTCCEKYCGCSKSCKNRFRGCHCAKSQCRSRQCPCFAAGRECDPDVCRNCWVSCGDGSLGEPPKRGDGQCGNMRLLLRQQQRILLAKSDVAGWGAYIKNPVYKNDYLGEYTGELISHREADKRGKIYDRANSSFLFDLNDQYVLDAYRKGDKLKFANHSSNPNCYAKVMLVAGDHRVGIFAKEHIEAGEELFYDYRYGPDQAPAWARKPEGSKRDDSSVSQGRPKKHQSH